MISECAGGLKGVQIVHEIVDANRYLVVATADAAGRPWCSPVYFAHIAYAEFLWVSSPEAAHSRNIAARPEVALVVFDSTAAIGTGQGVYMSARAGLVPDDEIAAGIEAFSRRSVAHGGHAWTRADVETGAELRLYRASADRHWILAKDGRPDHRMPVPTI